MKKESLKSILQKLYKINFINKKTKSESDYDYLTDLIKKKQINDLKLKKLKEQSIELAVINEILENNNHNYNEEEVRVILEVILKD